MKAETTRLNLCECPQPRTLQLLRDTPHPRSRPPIQLCLIRSALLNPASKELIERSAFTMRLAMEYMGVGVLFSLIGLGPLQLPPPGARCKRLLMAFVNKPSFLTSSGAPANQRRALKCLYPFRMEPQG